MNDYSLSEQELHDLQVLHRELSEKRQADRVKAIVLLGTGWDPSQVAVALLHRLGYVYKKPKKVPGKADAQAQKEFLSRYKKLKEQQSEQDVILFMDAVHPQHNPVMACGWIKRGKEFQVKSNTGRQRLNSNGAVNVETMSMIMRYDDTINAQSTIQLFDQIARCYPKARKVTVICDNARYYRPKLVQAYLESSKIALLFLPAYAPNVNLIERYWKYFKKIILYNRYYETFKEFKQACEYFFANIEPHLPALRTLLAENFQIIEGKMGFS